MSGAHRTQVIGLAAALLAAGALSAEKAPVGAAPQGEGLAAQVKKLEMDMEALKAAVKARDQTILQQREQIDKWRERAAVAEQRAEATQRRLEQLARQLQETQRALAVLKAGGAAPAAINPKGANPPAGMVKGKIQQVNPTDKRMVTVSVGTDDGVNVGNTLEVYRLKPQPRYLGRIQIIQASPRTSVGRLTRPLAKGETLEVGDEVASTIR
jgi:outer membrane murein-binding lipoprotein Lpp